MPAPAARGLIAAGPAPPPGAPRPQVPAPPAPAPGPASAAGRGGGVGAATSWWGRRRRPATVAREVPEVGLAPKQDPDG